MWWKKNKIASMNEDDNDGGDLLRIPSIDEHQQRHSRVILQTSPSAISFETSNIPGSALDVLDDLYSNRAHRRCTDRSYYTLLSMTLAVIFWICYWLTYNRCENSEDRDSNPFLCKVVIILEVLTFASLILAPVLFIFMIYSWIRYSCYNAFDHIREKFVGFKLEGNQWKRQLDYYYIKKKSKYFNCLRRKQRKELNDRGYGYIILSPYGIAIDELILFSNRKKIIDDGIVSDTEKLLNLTLKKGCLRFWKKDISIYLPDDLINQRVMEELMELFKIQINTDSLLPICY